MGAVNGGGSYGLLLTVVDGKATGKAEPDRFRIRIWDKLSGAIAYDEVPAAPDDLDLASPQEIGGGSILVHAK